MWTGPFTADQHMALDNARSKIAQIGQEIQRAKAAGMNVADLEADHARLARDLDLLAQHYGPNAQQG